MFYSHEILTDRKHGVATIWLVATLGSKSSLRKVNRKAILEVNVPKACQTITDPSAPMALRLQGSLLFGVSRVFSQQCAYVLTDIQGLQDKMRGTTMLLKELEIDKNASTTRPEQLNLHVDPDFDVDLDLGFDLSSFDTGYSSSEPSSMMSPRTLASSQTSYFDEDQQGLGVQARLEGSSSQGADGGFAFDVQAGYSLPPEPKLRKSLSVLDQEHGPVIAEDDSFHIEEDGSLVLREVSLGISSEHAGIDKAVTISGQPDDYDFGLDLSTDPPEQQQPTGPAFEDNYDFSGRDEEAPALGDQVVHTTGTAHTPSPQAAQNQQEADDRDVAEAAPQQRAKPARTVSIDQPAEVPNRTLSVWNDQYLSFMDEARAENAMKVSLAQARRNAAFWVLDQGVAGIDADLLDDEGDHPLAMFTGQSLLDMLSPPQMTTGRKRSASTVAEDEEDGERRVRARSGNERQTDFEEPAPQAIDEDEQGMVMEDDFEPEVGRHAEAPMSDHHDSMPWNVYASSRQGSRHGSRPAMSAAPGSSSIGRQAGFEFVPSSLGSKRVSRLIVESPLEQRRRLLRQGLMTSGGGQRGATLGSDTGEDVGFDIDDDELDRQLAGNLDDATNFELYGPAAVVSTAEAADPQWLAATLEREAFNFLTFLQTTIEGKQADLGGAVDVDEVDVTFEEMLPPTENSEVVAAQGLLHVLSLATKGLITVHQEDDFGDIHMCLVRGLAAASEEAEAEA